MGEQGNKNHKYVVVAVVVGAVYSASELNGIATACAAR